MNQQFKTPNSCQGELFETRDINWSMLSDEQRQQVIELLSKLFLDALRNEQTDNEHTYVPETIDE